MVRALAILLLTAAAATAEPFEPTLLAKLGSDRFRYPGTITKIRVSPDGTRVAVSGSAPTWVYDLATGRAVWQMPRAAAGGLLQPFAHAFRGDRLLALEFDFTDGAVIRTYDLHAPTAVHAVKVDVVVGGAEADFSPDGTLLAVPAKRRVTLLDTRTGREVNRVLLPRGAGEVEEVGFSANGRRLAVKSENGVVYTFDRLTGRELARFKPKPAARAFALSPDGNRVSAVLEDNSLESLNLLTGVRKKWKVRDLTFDHLIGLPGDRVLAVELSESKFQVYNAATGKLVRTLPPLSNLAGSLFEEFALAPDGRTLVCGASSGSYGDGIVTLLDVTTGRKLPQSADDQAACVQFRFHGAAGLSGLRPAAGRTPDDAQLAWARWRLPGDTLRPLAAGTDRTATDLSQDGRRIVSAQDAKIVVADTATGRAMDTLRLPPNTAVRAVWFREGDQDVGVQTADEVICWEPASNRVRRAKVASPAGQESIPTAGRWYATRSTAPLGLLVPGGAGNTKSTLTVHDLDTGRQTIQLDVDPGSDEWRFTPDGGRLVRFATTQLFTPDGTSYSRQEAQLLDPATGHVLRRFATDAGSQLLDIAADGRTFLIAGESDPVSGATGVASAVETATGKVRWRLPTLPDWSITGAGFAPDGRRLAVGSTDGFVRVWDLGGADSAPDAAAADRLWAALADADAEKAFDAVRTLGRFPDVAVPLLAAKLPPAGAIDVNKVGGWLADLESPRFAVRDAATKKLAAAMPQARPAIEELRKKTPSPEVFDRLTTLLEGAARLSPADVRAIRAVEALERTGTDRDLRAEARQRAVELLRAWAGGAGGAVLTAEAKEALARLRAAKEIPPRRPAFAPRTAVRLAPTDSRR